jgi:acetylornithine deacetylase/succinyl-diaminopimelate desuccinylase-like protein
LPAPSADGIVRASERPDLAAGAAAMIAMLEKLARDLGNETTIHATRLRSHPDSDDTPPDEISFTIDFRSPSVQVMAREHKTMSERLIEIAHDRRILVAIDIVHSQMPVEADKRIKAKAAKGAAWRGVEQITDLNVDLSSDLIPLSKLAPTLMIAVASDPDAVRTPRESCQAQDLVAATAILFETVKDRRLE